MAPGSEPPRIDLEFPGELGNRVLGNELAELGENAQLVFGWFVKLHDLADS